MDRRELHAGFPALRIIGTFTVIFQKNSVFRAKAGWQTHCALKSSCCRAYRNPDAFRGLEAYSHIWLIWQSLRRCGTAGPATVRPPRLGGNTRVGVFATRSPYRPSPIGLSCVALDRIEQTDNLGPVLHVRGADLLNGTPIYDIKPYLPYADAHPSATDGLAEKRRIQPLQVDFLRSMLCRIAPQARAGLIQALEQDPRPVISMSRRAFIKWLSRVSTIISPSGAGSLSARFCPAAVGENKYTEKIQIPFSETFGHTFPYAVWTRSETKNLCRPQSAHGQCHALCLMT
jgi:tRNA-Thr(GGU) m(6)t(6)A37 methyltransferase TsaA